MHFDSNSSFELIISPMSCLDLKFSFVLLPFSNIVVDFWFLFNILPNTEGML